MRELSDIKDVEFCYLTTTGRVTGKPHEIEIWFGLNGSTVYLMAGNGVKSDWVKNLLKNASVLLKIDGHIFHITAYLEKDTKKEMTARNLLADKYKERERDGSLSEWAQTALVVGMDLPPD